MGDFPARCVLFLKTGIQEAIQRGMGAFRREIRSQAALAKALFLQTCELGRLVVCVTPPQTLFLTPVSLFPGICQN